MVHAWADGIYVTAGPEKNKAALLLVIGALRDGRKGILSLRPGHREPTESWRAVLRDLPYRGLPAPRLGLADSGTPIRTAVGQVRPEAAQPRCWSHKILNVLNDLLRCVKGTARVPRTQILHGQDSSASPETTRPVRRPPRRGLSGGVTTLERDKRL